MLIFVIIVVVFVFLMIKFDNPAAGESGPRLSTDALIRIIKDGERIEELISQERLELARELHDELLEEAGYEKGGAHLAFQTENVITAYAEAGRFDEAGRRLAAFARAASEFNNPDLYLTLASSYRGLVRELALAGRFEAAVERFAELMDLPRTVHEEEVSELRISAAHWLCLCKSDLEPDADGLRCLMDIKLQLQELGCELDAPGEFAELLEELADYACSAGEPEAAAELYEEMLQLEGSPQVRAHQLRVAARICACHAERGELERAGDYFEKLPPLEDGRPCAAYHDAAAAVVQAMVEKGNYQEALAFHKQALMSQMLPGADIWSSVDFNRALLPALARASLKTGDQDGIAALRKLPVMPDKDAPPRSASALASAAASMAECLTECVEHYIETAELDQAVTFFRRLAEMEAAVFVGEGSKAFVEGEPGEDSLGSQEERRQDLLDGLDFDLALEKKYAAQALCAALGAAGREELAEELRALIDWERIEAILGPDQAEEPGQSDEWKGAEKADGAPEESLGQPDELEAQGEGPAGLAASDGATGEARQESPDLAAGAPDERSRTESVIDNDSEAAQLFERLFALLEREDLDAARSVYEELSEHARANAAALPDDGEALTAVLAIGPVQASSPEYAAFSAPLKKAVDAAHWQQVGAACLSEALIQGGRFKEARLLFDSIPVLDCTYEQDEDLPVTGGTGSCPEDGFSGYSDVSNAPAPASDAETEKVVSGEAASGLTLTGGGRPLQEQPLNLEAIYRSRHDARPNIWKGVMACGVIGALRKRGEFLECGKLYAQMTQYGDYQALRDLRARAQRLL